MERDKFCREKRVVGILDIAFGLGNGGDAFSITRKNRFHEGGYEREILQTLSISFLIHNTDPPQNFSLAEKAAKIKTGPESKRRYIVAEQLKVIQISSHTTLVTPSRYHDTAHSAPKFHHKQSSPASSLFRVFSSTSGCLLLLRGCGNKPQNKA